MIIEPLSNPIDKANQATGKIRDYQLVEGGTLLLILPKTYFVLKMGGPYTSFIVQLIVMAVVQVLRLFLVCYKIKMSKREYVKQVLLRVFIVAIVAAIIPVSVYQLMPQSICSFVVVVVVSVLSVLCSSYYLDLNKNEKEMINEKIQMVVSKISRKI